MKFNVLNQLKVSNLPEELTEDMVRQIFGPFGAIDSCLLINDPITQKFTGSGFVTFNEGECGKSAMRLVLCYFCLKNSDQRKSNDDCVDLFSIHSSTVLCITKSI